MPVVVDMIDKVLMNTENESLLNSIKSDVKAFMKEFPLYPELKAAPLFVF